MVIDGREASPSFSKSRLILFELMLKRHLSAIKFRHGSDENKTATIKNIAVSHQKPGLLESQVKHIRRRPSFKFRKWH